MEILIAVVVVGFFTSGVLIALQNSWFSSKRSNTLLVAGHLIEQEIERVRIHTAERPDSNFSYVLSLHEFDTVINNIRLVWLIEHPAPAIRDSVPPRANIARATLTAYWSVPQQDSLSVQTYLAKNF
jgi:type II secretory pathway pseudopilin PulG